jgi:hypothetical protein
VNVPPNGDAVRILSEMFHELLGEPSTAGVNFPGSGVFDVKVKCGKWTFPIEYKATATAASVAGAVEQLRHIKPRRNQIPLLCVPYLSEAGREICARRKVSWIDLSGNANIRAEGLLIRVEGRPNRYRPIGRPSSAFTPVASRVTRFLLAHPNDVFTQREIAKDSGLRLDEGFTSRIISKLAQDHLVERTPEGVRVINPALLLDAWAEVYDFTAHSIQRLHVSARSSEALLKEFSKKLHGLGVEPVATGLAGAWLHTNFAGFRLVTFFVDHSLDSDALDEVGARSVERGENVWLVVPNDVGVTVPNKPIQGIPCAHKAQVYVDLKGHPERASDAAAAVRASYLDEVKNG